MLLGIVFVLGIFYGMKRLTYQRLVTISALVAYVMVALFVAGSDDIYRTPWDILFNIAMNGSIFFAIFLGVSYLVFRKKLRPGATLPNS